MRDKLTPTPPQLDTNLGATTIQPPLIFPQPVQVILRGICVCLKGFHINQAQYKALHFPVLSLVKQLIAMGTPITGLDGPQVFHLL
jgi:hypothetical protein